MKNHIVAAHDLPEDNRFLERYVSLRFSKFRLSQLDAKKRKMIGLIRHLQTEHLKSSSERVKRQFEHSKVAKILLAAQPSFIDGEGGINLQEDSSENPKNNKDVETASLEGLSSWRFSAAVKWFINMYDVITNQQQSDDNVIDENLTEKQKSALRRTSASKKNNENVRVFRMKIVEKKNNVENDFRDISEFNPYETYLHFQQILYTHFFGEMLKKSRPISKDCSQHFHVLLEMTVEFARSDQQNQLDMWEYEGTTVYDQYGESSCSETRNLSEYLCSSHGPVSNYRNVYKESLASMKQKVGGSFNVTGSDWSLRRVVATNLSLVFDKGNSKCLYSPRLVKGKTLPRKLISSSSKMKSKVVRKNRNATIKPQFSVEMFEIMFCGCYEQLQMKRSMENRTKETLSLLRQKFGKSSRNTLANQSLPDLTDDDRKGIEMFAKSSKKELDFLLCNFPLGSTMVSSRSRDTTDKETETPSEEGPSTSRVISSSKCENQPKPMNTEKRRKKIQHTNQKPIQFHIVTKQKEVDRFFKNSKQRKRKNLKSIHISSSPSCSDDSDDGGHGEEDEQNQSNRRESVMKKLSEIREKVYKRNKATNPLINVEAKMDSSIDEEMVRIVPVFFLSQLPHPCLRAPVEICASVGMRLFIEILMA